MKETVAMVIEKHTKKTKEATLKPAFTSKQTKTKSLLSFLYIGIELV
eukprot:CAMPEP_0206201456 /NCGR_PEP_ID=MMETSP0166-20121206/11566_1 /ASSEMBLY_ACC=CAM_ASM_000260 /TAXON_ID=95228 /ORGANISM="Vannella robusta, Strain DIVA3 518/3/11/1/6" /LENGTH=46 /DNA_ID= /DNA_START= /DNA_END= /DNA_ORIENTATION=